MLYFSHNYYKITNTIYMIELFIRKNRIEKNMTQEELSRKSGISESYISELENNLKMPTILTLCKLAEALEVDINNLYKYTSN